MNDELIMNLQNDFKSFFLKQSNDIDCIGYGISQLLQENPDPNSITGKFIFEKIISNEEPILLNFNYMNHLFDKMYIFKDGSGLGYSKNERWTGFSAHTTLKKVEDAIEAFYQKISYYNSDLNNNEKKLINTLFFSQYAQDNIESITNYIQAVTKPDDKGRQYRLGYVLNELVHNKNVNYENLIINKELSVKDFYKKQHMDIFFLNTIHNPNLFAVNGKQISFYRNGFDLTYKDSNLHHILNEDFNIYDFMNDHGLDDVLKLISRHYSNEISQWFINIDSSGSFRNSMTFDKNLQLSASTLVNVLGYSNSIFQSDKETDKLFRFLSIMYIDMDIHDEYNLLTDILPSELGDYQQSFSTFGYYLAEDSNSNYIYDFFNKYMQKPSKQNAPFISEFPQKHVLSGFLESKRGVSFIHQMKENSLSMYKNIKHIISESIALYCNSVEDPALNAKFSKEHFNRIIELEPNFLKNNPLFDGRYKQFFKYKPKTAVFPVSVLDENNQSPLLQHIMSDSKIGVSKNNIKSLKSIKNCQLYFHDMHNIKINTDNIDTMINDIKKKNRYFKKLM